MDCVGSLCSAESPQQGIFFCGERKGDGKGQSREGRDLGQRKGASRLFYLSF